MFRGDEFTSAMGEEDRENVPKHRHGYYSTNNLMVRVCHFSPKMIR